MLFGEETQRKELKGVKASKKYHSANEKVVILQSKHALIMNKTAFLSIIISLVMAFVAGCAESTTNSPVQTCEPFERAEGDSSIYALVAEGTNDSILVYLRLPYDGSDPDTLSILETRRNRQVFGRTDIGDAVAVVRCADDTTKAASIIVTQDLLGSWIYEVYPTLRRTPVNDSLLPQRLKEQLSVAREYTLTMRNDYTVFSFAERGHKDDNMSPIVYPKARHYSQWRIYNGRLIFTETKRDSLDNSLPVGTDTADIIRLRRDTLVLHFAEDEHTYYRKQEE